MENYVSLQGITDEMMKLRVGVLYLDPEGWKWWEWHKKSYAYYISWSPFFKFVYGCFKKDTHYLVIKGFFPYDHGS
jgi:uncharacterized membrane protein YkgB